MASKKSFMKNEIVKALIKIDQKLESNQSISENSTVKTTLFLLKKEIEIISTTLEISKKEALIFSSICLSVFEMLDYPINAEHISTKLKLSTIEVFYNKEVLENLIAKKFIEVIPQEEDSSNFEYELDFLNKHYRLDEQGILVLNA